MKLYRCMHDTELICHEQGSQLWHFLCPRLFNRPYVPLSCPVHNSKTLWNIFMKLHRCIHHNKTMCHEQRRQLLHFYAPAYSKNSGRALSVTPVRPVRLSIRPSVCLSVRTSHFRVRAITTKPYRIYSWNFTGAYITLRRCVMNKEDNSCFFGFWIITPWFNSI